MKYWGLNMTSGHAVIPMFSKDTQGVPWMKLMKALNQHILQHTGVDDKQLGPWFLKAPESNRNFAYTNDVVGKLLFYLWADVFREHPRPVFNPELRTFEEVVECYENGHTSECRVFSQSVLDALK